MNNRRRGIVNIAAGMISQLVIIVLGLLLPRLFLVRFGSETNGFINSITQFFSYFTLFEAGVGTAALQALYGPAARDDRQRMAQILAAASRFYHRTGLCYLGAVAVLAVGYPLFVRADELSPVTMALVILLQGCGGAISYLFQGKYLILLRAQGKNYLISLVVTTVNVAVSGGRILLIISGAPLLAVQACFLVVNVAQMIFYQWYLKKNYGWLAGDAQPDYAAIGQKNSVLVHQFSTLVFNNTDVILLTVLARDLKIVSVYTIYNMILSMCRVLINQINEGVAFRLGQMYQTDRERYKRYHNYFELFNMTLGFCVFSAAYVLLVPFIRLYTAGVHDVDYVLPYLPLLFVLVQLISSSRQAAAYLIEFAGHFENTKRRSLLETGINLAVSIVLIPWWGIYGVLTGTIAALAYRANDMVLYTNKYILEEKPYRIYRRWAVHYLIFFAICLLAKRLPLNAASYGGWILLAIPVTLAVAVCYGAANLLTEYKTIRELFHTLKK